jgi:hypothetical protein
LPFHFPCQPPPFTQLHTFPPNTHHPHTHSSSTGRSLEDLKGIITFTLLSTHKVNNKQHREGHTPTPARTSSKKDNTNIRKLPWCRGPALLTVIGSVLLTGNPTNYSLFVSCRASTISMGHSRSKKQKKRLQQQQQPSVPFARLSISPNLRLQVSTLSLLLN